MANMSLRGSIDAQSDRLMVVYHRCSSNSDLNFTECVWSNLRPESLILRSNFSSIARQSLTRSSWRHGNIRRSSTDQIRRSTIGIHWIVENDLEGWICLVCQSNDLNDLNDSIEQDKNPMEHKNRIKLRLSVANMMPREEHWKGHY